MWNSISERTRDCQVYGIDDGYFPLYYKGGKGNAPIVISLVDCSGRLVDFDVSFIKVDGNDGNTVIPKIPPDKIVIMDGVIFAGFNYIEPRPPSIIFYRKVPNREEILNALMTHFPEDSVRLRVISENITGLERVVTRWGSSYIKPVGISLADAKKVLESYQIVSKIPEPVRISHVIGRAIGRYMIRSLSPS